MLQVSIIGCGNLAHNLLRAFTFSREIQLVQLFCRNKSDAQQYNGIQIIDTYQKLKEVDLLIIAVSDNNIELVSKQIQLKNTLIVHCSGSISMEVIQQKHRGVFYPLQTFSKKIPLTFKDFPIFIEAKNSQGFETLNTVAKAISNNVQKMNSEQRKTLHLSAVFVNNFVNHLYVIGQQITKEKGLDFSLLFPLINETAYKLRHGSPQETQTGPAIRNDQTSIKKQEALLNNSVQKKLYQLFTESIKNNNESKKL